MTQESDLTRANQLQDREPQEIADFSQEDLEEAILSSFSQFPRAYSLKVAAIAFRDHFGLIKEEMKSEVIDAITLRSLATRARQIRIREEDNLEELSSLRGTYDYSKAASKLRYWQRMWRVVRAACILEGNNAD